MEQNFWQRNMKWLIIVGVIAIVLIWGVSRYNSFINLNENVTKQWAQVDNQLQRRYDLIPNLVSTVKGVAKQEQDVFLKIAEARTKYSGATNSDGKAQAATQMESALSRLLVIVENYPVLQSSKAYQDLMVSLEGTENRVAVERGKYNELVQQINAGVKYFPSSIIAKMGGFTAREYFNVPDVAKVNPKVDFAQ